MRALWLGLSLRKLGAKHGFDAAALIVWPKAIEHAC
jgi:hypothetical protein